MSRVLLAQLAALEDFLAAIERMQAECPPAYAGAERRS